jgi:hypothetical protein
MADLVFDEADAHCAGEKCDDAINPRLLHFNVWLEVFAQARAEGLEAAENPKNSDADHEGSNPNRGEIGGHSNYFFARNFPLRPLN